MTPYGAASAGTILGEVTPFTRRTATTTEEYEASMQNVNGTTSVFYRKDGGTWTQAPGKSYNATARAHFCPIRDIDADYNDQDKVLVTNGQDFLSYLDINTLTVVPFVALTTPAKPTLTVGAGIAGAGFPQRYKVTAGNRGETPASVVESTTTTKPRSEWAGATEFIDVTATLVSGSKKYHFYYGTEVGAEVYIGSVDAPASGTTVTFRDSGVSDPNIYRPAPASDTTAGPIATRASFINGQVFLTGDKTNPKYVRYGGTGKNILDFSPYGGGGYEPVGGNKEVPVRVAAFRRPSGDSAITVICNSDKRYIFTPATLGNISYFAITEDDGDNLGTTAPDSLIVARNQLWYLSAVGVQTTLTKAQIQTILATESVGDNIENFIKRFNTLTLGLSCGLVHENRLYWAVAAGAEKNNLIMVLDLSDLRRGAWTFWNVAADWMWLSVDNTGKTHFCVLQNNQVLEFTDSISTQDNGVAFPTSTAFGIQKNSDDGEEYASFRKVKFVFNDIEGTIVCSVAGKTEGQPFTGLSNETFTAQTIAAGWGEATWGELTWGETLNVPQAYSQERIEIDVDMRDEELKSWEPSISTNGPNCSYELLEIIPIKTPIGIKE